MRQLRLLPLATVTACAFSASDPRKVTEIPVAVSEPLGLVAFLVLCVVWVALDLGRKKK